MALLRKKAETRRGLVAPSKRSMPRPEPDEAPLDESQPTPQPERREAPLDDPGLRDLSFTDYKAIVKRAGKEFMSDNCMMLASALAYSTFFAIPSVIIVAVGLFTLVASPATITALVTQHLSGIIPGQAQSLLLSSLKRADANPGSSILMTVIGFLLAVWAVTGAMNSYMTAINLAYDREKDRRSFVKKRIVALKMAAIMGVAFLLVAVLLIFGPPIESAIANAAGSAGVVVTVAWWAAQWPILLGGLLVAFAALLYLGPDVDHPKWEYLTPGSVVAALLWLAASGLFAVYTATFASYNKTWGSLAAVIIMLTWLWLSSLALLFGAETNAEADRTRARRQTT